MSQISFNLFCSGDKRFLPEFLRKWVWFQGDNERFPKYLGWTSKFQKTETRFSRLNSTDNNDSNIFLSLENPCTFFLAKEKPWKRIFNTNSKLTQNGTEKQFMPSKTTVNLGRPLCFPVYRYLLKAVFLFQWSFRVPKLKKIEGGKILTPPIPQNMTSVNSQWTFFFKITRFFCF